MSGSSGTHSFIINGTYTYTDTNGHWLGGAMVSSHTTQSSGQGWSEPETETVNTYVWRDSAILASTSYEADAEHTATIPGHWDPSGFNCWIPDQEVTIGNDTAWVTNYSYDAEGNLILADINDGQPWAPKAKGPAKLPRRRCTGPGTTLKGEKSGAFAAPGG